MSPLDPFAGDSLALSLAYIDPGAGSIVLQMLLAGVAGAFVFFKYHGRRLASWFKRTGSEADQPEGE